MASRNVHQPRSSGKKSHCRQIAAKLKYKHPLVTSASRHLVEALASDTVSDLAALAKGLSQQPQKSVLAALAKRFNAYCHGLMPIIGLRAVGPK